MARITSIKQQKDKGRVNIYLDGKFGFGLDLENFVKLKLRIEQELSPEQIAGVVKKSEHQKILNRLLNFATLRPRSVEEVKSWLRRKKVPEDMQPDLFSTLTRLDLIDDEKFAKWWVEQRATFRPKGKKALRFELLKKGIDRRVIDEVLNQSGLDEGNIALHLLERKRNKWERMEEEVVRQKMYEYLARQGFDLETVKKVVKRFILKNF